MATAGELKLGVTCWKASSGWSAQALCGQAEAAQAMGFHSYWLPENHFGDQFAMPSPLTQLAAVAARTAKIKLGTVSYLIPIRPPLLAAEEVAVLDQLSGGRVILGVGRGIQDPVFKAFDLPSKDKRKRFAENLDIMRRAWAGEPIIHDAHGNPVYLAPLPVQRPSLPIWVAAFGPLALKQVASLGLPYLASPMETLSTLRDNYRSHERGVVEAKHPPVHTVPIMRSVFIADRSSVSASLKKALDKQLLAMTGREPESVDDWAIIGDSHYVRDKLEEYVQQLGMTHLILSGRLPGIDSARVQRSHGDVLEVAGQLSMNSLI
jgi:alkanesulfonate monooxygenase SsuD/methylene tetrahydromethanopterin reductase-like flavin-dependent oxidoreductase (luciferase family)